MRNAIKKASHLAWIGVFVLLVIASFWDLQISDFVFNPTSFYYKLFGGIGELPVFVFSMIAGLLLIRYKNSNIKWIGILQLIGGVLLVLYGVLLTWASTSRYWFESTPVIGFIFPIVFFGVVFLTTRKYFFHLDRKKAIQLSLFFALLVVGALVLVTVIRFPWGRMRYFYMIDPAQEFTQWFIPQGVGSIEAVSFPSGHAANAAVAFGLLALPLTFDNLKKHETTFFIIALLWSLLVAGSRVVGGMHFLSDVTFSILLVMALTNSLLNFLFYKPERKMKA